MAWNNADDLVVAGTGQVYVAPVGTALPTTPGATLNAAFVGLGYHTEDGVSISVEPTVEDYMAWQSKQPVRREFTAQDITITFALMQWDEDTVPLAFGGGVISSVSGGYRYDFPADDDALDERSIVVDCVDGDELHRFVFQRGSVTDAVESTFARNAPATLPISFKVLAPTTGGSPGYYLTDSTAFAAGS